MKNERRNGSVFKKKIEKAVVWDEREKESFTKGGDYRFGSRERVLRA